MAEDAGTPSEGPQRKLGRELAGNREPGVRGHYKPVQAGWNQPLHVPGRGQATHHLAAVLGALWASSPRSRYTATPSDTRARGQEKRVSAGPAHPCSRDSELTLTGRDHITPSPTHPGLIGVFPDPVI